MNFTRFFAGSAIVFLCFVAGQVFAENKSGADPLDSNSEAGIIADVPEVEAAGGEEITAGDSGKDASEKGKKPFWGYKTHKPISHLLVVSNYRIPHDVLAEYCRKELNIPYILLPANPEIPDPNEDVFFIGGKETMEVLKFSAFHLSKFLAFLRPQNVLFLGDQDYIHPVYYAAVPSSVCLLSFDDSEWKVNLMRLDVYLKSHKSRTLERYLAYLRTTDAEAVPNAENYNGE